MAAAVVQAAFDRLKTQYQVEGMDQGKNWFCLSLYKGASIGSAPARIMLSWK